MDKQPLGNFMNTSKPWNGKINPRAYQVHQLSKGFLDVNGKDLGIVIQSFLEFVHLNKPCYHCSGMNCNEEMICHPTLLVMHNASFDVRKLNEAIQCFNNSNNGDNKSKWSLIQNDHVFCTMKYFRSVYAPKGYGLDKMASYCSVDNADRKLKHGALTDAMILAKCLQKLWQLADDKSIQ